MSNYHTSEKPLGQSVLSLWKERGETLATLLDRTRAEYGLTDSVPLTYAGRLDPMAEGLVIVLVGEECKNKDAYLGLDKEYVFEILFGMNTDTYDALGIIEHTDFAKKFTNAEIEDAVLLLKEKKDFTYPPYSSKTVVGKSLLNHAREGTLPDELPFAGGEVKELSVVGIRQEKLSAVIDEIISSIAKVEGDFRQSEIIKYWNDIKEAEPSTIVPIATCRAVVTSGFYIRSLANEVGKVLGIPTIAYTIKRTKIG